MRFSENRVIAWIVLAVCVIGSVVGLGGAGMAREQKQVLNVFYEGADDRDPVHCMNAYLKRAADCGQMMAGEAELLLGASDNSRKMQEAAAIMQEVTDPASLADAYWDIYQLSDQLYNAVYGANLTDGQRTNFKLAYDDFWGNVRFIEKDPYHELARAYNKALSGGLAPLAGGIFGARELCDTFI